MWDYTNEKRIYLEHLRGKIMKILYLYEDGGATVSKVYTGGLLINIDSANKIFDGIFIEILVKIYEIDFEKMQHKDVRKRVLEATNMADKMLKEIKL